MELIYEGTDEELEAFLIEHTEDSVVLPFKLGQERIAALGREVEERPTSKSVVTMMGAGTTVVVQVNDVQHNMLHVVPTEEVPAEPVEEPAPDVGEGDVQP